MRIIEGFQAAKTALSRYVSQAFGSDEQEQAVRQIINDVRDRGDAALFDYTEKFDGVRLSALEVDREQIENARREIDVGLLSALELAARRITAYHERQKSSLLHENTGSGLGWLVRPLQRVGVHIPGFTAPLPSSLLMTVVPAKVAGVKEIILVTPPQSNGKVAPVTLATASIAGVDRVFSVGGAQAIAALAYGTGSIPGVDKICGPGNIYVTLAKKLVYGFVGIDGLYGPSEVIIIADETARAEYCAADLLAQAEHPSASAILLTTSQWLADEVKREITKQLAAISRRDVASKSLEDNGLIAVVSTVDEALELANLYAPEHLCLMVANAADYIDKVENAGCLFVGENSIEAIVDYIAGPSHVLPTEGTARYGSGLSILDFVKLVSLVNTDEDDIKELGRATVTIARAERLEAHARAVEKRLENMGQGVN